VVTETYSGGLNGGYEAGPSARPAQYQPAGGDEKIVRSGFAILSFFRSYIYIYGIGVVIKMKYDRKNWEKLFQLISSLF
jgi:hypothetical protein